MFQFTVIYIKILLYFTANGIRYLLIFAMLVINTAVKGQVKDPQEGQIRLDGDGKGRVEIYHANEWGTLCFDFWDMNDGNVVCRELGYPKAMRVYIYVGDDDKTPIWLDNVRCEGIETNLTDCASNGWNRTNCLKDHTEDAAVECQNHGRI